MTPEESAKKAKELNKIGIQCCLYYPTLAENCDDYANGWYVERVYDNVNRYIAVYIDGEESLYESFFESNVCKPV